MPGVVYHEFTSPILDATGTIVVGIVPNTSTVAASNLVQPQIGWNTAHLLGQGLIGNTVGQQSVSGSNIWLSGGNNITLSAVQGVDEATIGIVGGAGGGGGSLNVSAGTTSNNLTNLVFANGSGVSFGLDGSTITATVQTNYLTTARASNDGIGLNTAQSNVTWTVNSAGLSFDARGYAGTGTTFGGTNISGSITQNSNGIALSLSGLAALTSQSNQNVTAANGGFAFQTLSFSNAQGVSFATSAGSAIVASVVTSYRASNDAIGLNTAQSNVTWTVNSSGLSLDARGYAGTGTTFGGTNVSASATLNSGGLQLSLSVANPGGAGAAVNWYENVPLISATSLGREFGSTSHAEFFVVGLPLTASYLRLAAQMATQSTSLGTTANTTFSGSVVVTNQFVIYTQNIGASSQSLASYTSGSVGSTMLHSIQANANGSEYTVSNFITYPAPGGITSTFSSSYASTSASIMLNSAWQVDFTGVRWLDTPLVTSLPASNYWILFGVSTNSAAQVAAVSRCVVTFAGGLINRQPDTTFGSMNIVLNASIAAQPGVGSFTTAGGGTTASLGFSNISSKASHPRSYFQIGLT